MNSDQYQIVGVLRVQKINKIDNIVYKHDCKVPRSDVFDIEVEDNHNFIACGLDGIGPIVHNCHHTSAEVFSQALKKISFRYTIGLSATINRKDGLAKVFKWYLGDVVYKSTKRKDTVKVEMKCFYDASPKYSTEHKSYGKLNISKMINNVCDFAPRAEFIINMIKTVLEKEEERKILILSDRRTHLQTLYEQLKIQGFDVGIYMGGMKQEVLNDCENKQIILATFAIAAEGYDQKGLDTLILASPKSDVIQAVGRILRDKEHERKHVPLILDIVDKFSIFEKQGMKRLNYYKSMGYTIKGTPDLVVEKTVLEPGKCLILD
jgi:superfamily II DNA or RNA helicase